MIDTAVLERETTERTPPQHEQITERSAKLYETLTGIMSDSVENHNVHRPMTKQWPSRFWNRLLGRQEVSEASPNPELPKKRSIDAHYARHDTDGEIIIETVKGLNPQAADTYILQLNRVKGSDQPYKLLITKKDGARLLKRRDGEEGFEPAPIEELDLPLLEAEEVLRDYIATLTK